MRRYLLTAIFIFLIFLMKDTILAQDNANEGTRFLVTFPLNDDQYRSDVNLGIYVYSKYDTKVSFKNHYNGISLSRNLNANSFLQLDRNELGTRGDLEDSYSEQVSNKVIEITSTRPISISLINSKKNSSESYLAYPVSEWGKNYIHNSFYNFYYSNYNRASGFTIISASPNTNVKVILKGRGKNIGTSSSGKYKIGDTITFTLDDNKSYSVRTQSNNLNSFDFSGSLIISNKPIGVISFNERTLLPQKGTGHGQDNLLEMQQPLSNWRNKFVSIDLGRSFGDMFRVLPLSDNTTLKISNYNENGSLESTESKIISTGGEFYEYNNTSINDYNRERISGIKGNTVWEADAPILVTQYSYSQYWDKTSIIDLNDNYDPFMMNLINEEQFTKNINFLVPPYNDFENHKLNLIIKVDTTIDISTQLQSITLNNRAIYLDYSQLMTNRIGNTEYYWLRINLQSGTYNISSDVRFGAFLYGFGNADSYGMQTALGNLPLIDTLVIGEDNFDCKSIDVEYNIRSTFAFEEDGEFEGTNFKIDSFAITKVENANINTLLSSDSLDLQILGEKIDFFAPSIVHLEVFSESGRIFYDTIKYEYFENIAINENISLNSVPGEVEEFEVFIDENKDSLQFLKNYSFAMKYRSDMFYFKDMIIADTSVYQYVNQTFVNDTTTISLNETIQRELLVNGNKIKIYLETMLSTDSLKKPVFILSSIYNEICYKGTKSDTINVGVCGGEFRVVSLAPKIQIKINESKLYSNTDISITIYDISGRILYNNIQIEKDQSIDLESIIYSSGLYFIRINNSHLYPPLKYFHF